MSQIAKYPDQATSEIFQLNIQLSTLISNAQYQELSQFLNTTQLPETFLTQYLSNLLDNKDNTDIINLFLAHGANVNAIIRSARYNIEESECITLLMFSIISNNLKLFDIIMTYHPDITLSDQNGKNAVVYAILFNEDNKELMLMRLLAENKNAINTTVVFEKETHNLITLATLKNKKNLVDTLMRHNVDVNYQTTPRMDTCLHIAVKNDNVEIAELIYKNGLFNRELVNKEGKTAKVLAKDIKQKVYYTLFAREQEMIKKGGEKKVYNDKRKVKVKRRSEDIEIPIEFVNNKLNSVLRINENDTKLCINTNLSPEEIKEEIERVKKSIKEKENAINNYNTLISQKEQYIMKLTAGNEMKDKEIREYKKTTREQKKNISEIENQIKDITEALKNQNDPSSQHQFLTSKYKSEAYNDNYIYQCLQKDLTDYQRYVKEVISHKRPMIEEIIKNIQSAVDEVNKDYKVMLYGSYSTGLCLPWSDIDVVLCKQSDNHIDDYMLSNVYMRLIKKHWILSHKFIENTNIPIIKLVSNDIFQFHIDISVKNEKHFGLKCVELVKSYLNKYEILEPIILALKTLLNNGNLNNPYTGGLSSYGLILMVVSFIQSQIDNHKFNSNSQTILGENFITVLGHYGIFFDFTKYVIMTNPVKDGLGECNKDSIFPFAQNNQQLIIVDPLNLQNNVAKSSFQFMNIKMAFMIAYMVAKEDCECGCHYDILPNKHSETEHCILKRIFNSVKRFSEANKTAY